LRFAQRSLDKDETGANDAPDARCNLRSGGLPRDVLGEVVLARSSGQSMQLEVLPMSGVGKAPERVPIIRSFETRSRRAPVADPNRRGVAEFGPVQHDELENVAFDRTLRT